MSTVRLKLRRRQGRLPSAVGPRELLRLVEKIYSGKSERLSITGPLIMRYGVITAIVDTSGWRQRLDGETTPTCAPPSPSISSSDSEGEDSEPLAAKCMLPMVMRYNVATMIMLSLFSG